MSVKMHFDTAGNVENPTLVLAYKNGRKIGNIFNTDSLNFSDALNDGSTISFQTYKQMDGNIYNDWSKLNDFKLLWIPEWDRWFSINVSLDENDTSIKKVEGKSLGESELSQIILRKIEINTEADIAREDYSIPTIFYNIEHPEASLLDRLLNEKGSHYVIKHVDVSLINIQRIFSFDGTSILDAFKEISEEIGCIFILSSCSDENGRPERGIYVYDLEDRCLDCGYRDVSIDKCPKCGSTNIKSGYGEDTTIFISRDNLASEITYTTDHESVKNCFKLEAGDDLMNAAIRACNPNGSDYIWGFSDSSISDMSDGLREKIKNYNNLYSYYQGEATIDLSSELLNSYNFLIEKYQKYTDGLTAIPSSIVGYSQLMNIYYDTIDVVLLLQSSLMPNITLPEYTAQQQIDTLISEIPNTLGTTNLTGLSLSTADNIVLSYARSIIYSAFKVEIDRSTLTETTWNGNFVITNYSDKDDTATSELISININDNYEAYVKQKIEKILNKSDQDIYGITGLFKQSDEIFKSELTKYSLNRLNSFYSSCQACLDIMIQSKASDPNGTNSDIYSSLYVPYLNKLQYIQDEINVRDKEISIVQGSYNNQGSLVTTGLQQELIKKRDEIQNALNFEKFVGEELWKELLSFRREDTYQNSNYVSDGLSNNDLFQNARDFIEKATKELYKSSNLQHSITSTLKNFLRMKEFSPIVDYFEVGNWIRIEIDGQIYKLRILDYEIDFEDTENISVTFSDVEQILDGYSDLQSIYNKTNSLSTSYDSLVQQSEINSNGVEKVNSWIQKGLDMTNLKIISDAEHQNVSWDEHGLLCREYNDILDDYNLSQLKIINDGLYITDDGWKTARTGIGRFTYFDPKDLTYKEGYGVIADTIVSNLILSEEVGIYNEEKSIEMGKDGIIVTTNTTNKNVFTIQKEYTDDDGNVFLERQLYIDDNGNIVLGGGAKITWDNVVGGSDYVDNAVGDVTNNLDTLKTALGFRESTTITGEYVFSPNIVGGHIYIGDGSGNINAEITTDGKLVAKGAEISGTIYATDGSFTGSIYASSGKIGGDNGFNINAGKIYSGMETFASTSNGVYVGTDGIALGGGKFKVDSSGNLTATSGTFGGTLSGVGGNIGGFTIGTNALYNGAGTFGGNGVYVSTSGISCGDKFKVDSSGVMNVKNANIIGNIVARSITAQDKYKIFYSDVFDDTMSPSSRTFVKGMTYDSGTSISKILRIGENADNNDLCISFNRDDVYGALNPYVLKSISLTSDEIYLNGLLNTIKMKNDNRYNLQASDGSSISGIFASDKDVVTIASNSYSTLLRGKTITASATISTTSDERLKKDFRDLSLYEKFFMDIEPISFKYKNGNSGRYHIGVKAQQVLSALENNGLSSMDFAGYIEMPLNKDMFEGDDEAPEFETMCNIGYSEFTSLNTYMTQKAHRRIDELEEIISSQKNEISMLKSQNKQQQDILNQLAIQN